MAGKYQIESCKPVRRLSREMLAVFNQVNTGNQKHLVELLKRRPDKVVVGEYRRKTRLVHLPVAAEWKLKRQKTEKIITMAIPPTTIGSAVKDINERLRKKNLPFFVRTSCRSGSLRNRIGKRLGKKKTPYFIGIVRLPR